MSDSKEKLDKDVEKKRGRVTKRVFGPTYDGVRDNKDSIKKNLILKEKKEVDDNAHKVHSFRETCVQEFKGVLLRLPSDRA